VPARADAANICPPPPHEVHFERRETSTTEHEKNRRRSMSKKILLLGVLDSILLDVQQQVARPNFEYLRGTSVEDIRSVLARTTIDYVIRGGGLPLETRLEMVRVIFESSETASVHMKDVASGSQGFLPFVRSVLSGL
jgi:hypothetical protein